MKISFQGAIIILIFNWDSFHARKNSHYQALSYNKNKHKRLKHAGNLCLLILELKPFRLWVSEKSSIGKKFQSLAEQGKKLLI